MRYRKSIQRLCAASSFLLLIVSLTGCMGSTELNGIFIVTGIALDKAAEPNQIDIAVQVAKSESGGTGASGSSNSESKSSLLLKSEQGSLSLGLAEIELQNSRTAFLHHNQVILFGSELAKTGIERHIDMLIRHHESRMEVPVVVVDGKAEDVLSAKSEQEKVSGIFLSKVMEGQNRISEDYKVRLLEFVSRLINKTSSPVATLVKVEQKEGQKTISFEGLAVFNKDKLVGRLNSEEAQGYVWALGGVKNDSFKAESGPNAAVFLINKLSSKRVYKIRQDGGIRVELSVDAQLSVQELINFDDAAMEELIEQLTRMSRDEIKHKIEETFELARTMGADIYEFGFSFYRKHPKEWKKIENKWDETFRDIELDVKVKTTVQDMGESAKTIQMEEAVQ